ncbi:alkaline phosphatase-like [Haliotis rufescens]|uniref:alkaline phosphatase-like n=1 Tax=Haliotis rufescens TaxID=6454 RepID=UPI00201E7CA2|nr:alkaline phosphatase-like [Haliotis rufescens]
MRVAAFVLCLLLWCATLSVVSADGEEWVTMAQKTLMESLQMKPNTNVAKNVIFFLGDGMGVSTVTAGRIYTGQTEGNTGEETVLSFEKFSNVALSKTYNVDRQTADSAGTATAFLCGVKANLGTLGVSESVAREDCDAQDAGKVESILKWSLDEGKAAGIVTTARVTHATPAAGYAHSAERDWEGDADTTKSNVTGKCKDIAQQLVDNLDLQVVMGGGRRYFLLNNQTDPETGEIDPKHRADGRDLINDWKNGKGDKNAMYVWNKAQFDSVNPAKTDYLLGLFESSHMQYDIERNSSGDGEPSLAEMTKKAIEILKKNDKGFFLLVESGRIDHGHHDTYAKRALHEVKALHEAVKATMDVINDSDTLVVVTADHSHVFTIGGYPSRGNNILDKVDRVPNYRETIDKNPYTTLSYGNGPQVRRNLTEVDTTDVDFRFTSAVPLSYETHGGEDVAIFAHGPMAHLFHGVHEQNYIPHVMAYASCVGINKKHCDVVETANGSGQNIVYYYAVVPCLSLAVLLSGLRH